MDDTRAWSARTLLGLFLVLSAGCGVSVEYTQLNPSARPLVPRSPSTVEVLTVSPARPFTEIGVIDLRFNGATGNSDESARQAAVQEAAKHGCDAVILKREIACIVYTDSH